MGKQNSLKGKLSMLFLILENSEIPELWELFHLWHYSYLA